MFDYPPATHVSRTIPKSKFFDQGKPNHRLKKLFTQQIQHILWLAKLSPDTLKIPATPQVIEIEVFHLTLKGTELHHDVLDAMDAAISHPIIFLLESVDGLHATSAAYKRPSEAAANQWIVGSRFITAWSAPSQKPAAVLPSTLDLSQLYLALFQPLLPLAALPAETLAALTQRCGNYLSLQKQASQLSQKISREKQFNRRVDYNRQLNALKAQLTLMEQVT